MRDSVAETFADALAMSLVNDKQKVRVSGSVYQEFDLGRVPFRFGLKVVAHFDNKPRGEAALLLQGPGDLLLLLGHTDHKKMLTCAILDGRDQMFKDSIMRSGIVEDAVAAAKVMGRLRHVAHRNERSSARWKPVR